MSNVFRLGFLVALSGTLLAACGGGGSSTGNSSPPTAAPVAATAQVDAVQVTVSGAGTVTSLPSGITCRENSSCNASFPVGSTITLNAQPGAGYGFAGWSGACSGSGTSCTTSLPMQSVSAVAINAIFTPGSSNLQVNVSGSGSVSSSPAGINCASTCTASFVDGTSVQLTAVAAPGYSFSGWGGACSGTAATCTVTTPTSQAVINAIFTPASSNLQVNISGSGSVSSSPAGINCASTCAASFVDGTSVQLTAVAASGYSFSGWGGACSGTAATCTVTIATSQAVSVTFSKNVQSTQTLNVTISGSGTVASSPAGISCNGTTGCSASFASGTSVKLTASASSGYSFSGWTGACSGASVTCTLTTSASETVNAIFSISLPVAGAPLVLYTDVNSGPNSGGENGAGAYLSIFGKNFGNTGLGSTVTVTIGGVAVSSYRYLGVAKGRPDVGQITVQVGALGNPAAGTLLPIRVTVNGVVSNTDQTFTVNPGRMLYVSNVNGNDSTAVGGDITHPYRHVQNGSTGAFDVAKAGDTIVMRGTAAPNVTAASAAWIDQGNGGYFMRFIGVNGTAPTGASGTGPIALIGYPTEDVYIYLPSSSGASGGITGVDTTAYTGGRYVTIADLRVESGGNGGVINQQIAGQYWRVVNNELTAATATNSALAGGITGNGTGSFWVGNHIHNIAGGSNQEMHGIYIDGDGSYEVAYNLIETVSGGNGFQIYVDGSNGSTVANNVSLHHNMIYGVSKHGINIADNAQNGIVVFDNVVYNIAYAGLRFNSTILNGAKIYNNTFYNTNTNGNAGYGTVTNDATLPNTALNMENNIFYPVSGGSYTGGANGLSSGIGTVAYNLYYGGNGGTSPDTHPVTGNPLFVNPGTDFHLSAGSAAIDTGSSAVAAVVTNDYDITTARPQGAGYDIGAYEYK